MEIGRPSVFPHFSRRSATAPTRIMFPIIMHGNMAGIAAIIGLPVIEGEVIGVIIPKMIPHAGPA